MKKITFILLLTLINLTMITAQTNYESDVIKTSGGELKMTFFGHASLMFEYNNLIIYLDPVGRYADYSKMPKADIILVTHEHGDHLDMDAINKIKKKETKIICTELCAEQIGSGEIMRNGDKKQIYGINVDAVPAYNIIHKRNNGEPFHPKGIGNGYILTFGNKKVYVAGDTENIPEMKNLTNIDIAFLPMNLPYTMSPGMLADAVKMFNPKILYPYHYGDTDVNELLKLMKDKKDCEIRIRKLK